MLSNRLRRPARGRRARTCSRAAPAPAPSARRLIRFLLPLAGLAWALTAGPALGDEPKPLALASVLEHDQFIANIAPVPGEPEAQLLAERDRGRILYLPRPGAAPQTVVDLKDRLAGDGKHFEQGLLGLALPPGYPRDRRLYAVYTNRFNQWVLSRFALDDAALTADPASEEVLIRVDRYAPFHACGTLSFNPKDGHLYACLGDGDQSGINSVSRQLQLLHGKILRIDVSAPGKGYRIPADNPFVGRRHVRPEIWALGLRNPWQFAFDPETGDAVIPDVGSVQYEEINLRRHATKAAPDFGWPRFEGDFASHVQLPECESNWCSDADLVWPVWAYRRTLPTRCAVIGGAVLSGERAPALRGAFLYADLCGRNLEALRRGKDGWERAALGTLPGQPVAIRTTGDGRLSVAFMDSRVARLDPATLPAPHWQPALTARRQAARIVAALAEPGVGAQACERLARIEGRARPFVVAGLGLAQKSFSIRKEGGLFGSARYVVDPWGCETKLEDDRFIGHVDALTLAPSGQADLKGWAVARAAKAAADIVLVFQDDRHVGVVPMTDTRNDIRQAHGAAAPQGFTATTLVLRGVDRSKPLTFIGLRWGVGAGIFARRRPDPR